MLLVAIFVSTLVVLVWLGVTAAGAADKAELPSVWWGVHDSSRMYIVREGGVPASPWHDVPLWARKGSAARMVVEIPRGTRAKMEVAVNLPLNPIVQVSESRTLFSMTLTFTGG